MKIRKRKKNYINEFIQITAVSQVAKLTVVEAIAAWWCWVLNLRCVLKYALCDFFFCL